MTAAKSVLVIGGSSDIGHATALRYAQAGWQVALAARDVSAAQRNADDVKARSGVDVPVHALDVLATDKLADFVGALPVLPDTVISMIGELGDQKRAETDLAHAAMIMRTNFEAPSLLLGLFANAFQARGSGTIVGVSSVAGDRGRGSNYVYGAAKAGFSQFLSGLRNRMALAGGVRVVTVKPPTETPMTAHLRARGAKLASPEEVAQRIVRGVQARKRVVYAPAKWALIMMVIRHLPHFIFRRMDI